MKLKLLAATCLVALHSATAYAAPIQTFQAAGPTGNASLSDRPTAPQTRSATAKIVEGSSFRGAASGNQAFKVNISGNNSTGIGAGARDNGTGPSAASQSTFVTGGDTPSMLLTALGVMASIARRRRLAKKLS